MKTLSLLCLSGMLALASVSRGQAARAEINPALLYYQAFQVAPDLSPPDRDYLFNREWRGQKLPDRVGKLLARSENQLKLARQAAQSTVRCDWGVDLTAGPATLLPHLARSRGLVQTLQLHARWALQSGQQKDAVEDLVAAFVLARNSARDGTLISALVQTALENLVCASVAESFHQFSTESLRQIQTGIEAAPVRRTMADCMPVEKQFVAGWLAEKVRELQKANPRDEAKAMEGIREVFLGLLGPDEANPGGKRPEDRWKEVAQAAGGTSEGIVKLLDEQFPLYDRFAKIMTLPYAEYQVQSKAFFSENKHTSNPLFSISFPAVSKTMPKEFASIVQCAMVRAAIALRTRGEAGFNGVADPFGTGPFESKRFIFQGVDRGFQLQSAYDGRGFRETLIFVEKDGAPFHVSGKDAGQSIVQVPAR